MAIPGINPAIFRAYDIRGIYGKDLDEKVMEMVGAAFGSLFVKGMAVVGMDGRTSGPALKEAFLRGLAASGKDAADIGVVPRGACLYHAWKDGLPSAYITASHLTGEWNGVKFAYGNGIEFFEKDNERIKKFVLSGSRAAADEKGSARKEEATAGYVDFILSKMKPAVRRLSVVLDCGNGTGGLAAPELFRKLGFSVTVINGEVDGTFPNRPSEIDEQSLSGFLKRVRGHDMGIAFDGDSDRMAMVDEKGRLLGPEAVSYLVMNALSRDNEGPVVANVECLKILDEMSAKLGRKIYRVRVGNSFLVQAIMEKKAFFGVERSGHYCIPSIIPVDDGMAVGLYAALVLSASDRKLSEIVDEIPLYPFRRLKADCPDELKFRVVANLKKKFSKEYKNVNTVDGVRVDLGYGWVLVRASNTGPVIRVSAEADNEEKVDEISGKFLSVLKEEIGRVRSS